MNPIKDEPVITAVLTLLGSAATLALAFGVTLTGAQIAAVSQFVQAALVIAFLVRSQVTPKAHVAAPADPLAPATATGV